VHRLFFWTHRFWLAHTSIRCWKGSVLSCGGYNSDWNSCRPMTVCTYYTQRTHSSMLYAYLFTTAACTDSPELPLYDGVLYVSHSSRISFIDLDDHKWSQALLPVRWSRLRIRTVVSLAPSAYMASAASTAEFMSSLLPTQLREVVDSGVRVNRHVGLHHADFRSVNIFDSYYILLPGSFTPIPSGRSLRPAKIRGKAEEKNYCSIHRTINSLALIKFFHILSHFA
jgi:hypothetical protein